MCWLYDWFEEWLEYDDSDELDEFEESSSGSPGLVDFVLVFVLCFGGLVDVLLCLGGGEKSPGSDRNSFSARLDISLMTLSAQEPWAPPMGSSAIACWVM